MYVDLTHTSSFTSSDEHHAHTHREVQAAPSRSDRVTTRRRTWRGDVPLTKSPAHHLERLVKENTMDSGIMARLEVEDPLLACHDQTAGWLNRVWVESGR